MKLSVDFYGEDIVASQILGVGDRSRDLRPAFRKALHTLERSAARQFDSEGVYGSAGWTPLAPSTVAEKAAKGLDPRIMHRTYRLRDALAGKNADRIGRVNRQSLVYGSSVDYAGYHQAGTSNMPRRPLVKPTKGDRREITRFIYERLMHESGRA